MKTFRAVWLLVVCAVAILACKKKNEETPVPVDTAVIDKLAAHTWKGDSVQVKASASLLFPTPLEQKITLAGTSLTFAKDKTFTFKLAETAELQSGTWELLSNSTKIKFSGGFQRAFADMVNDVIDQFPLPQGVVIKSVTLPDVYDIATLTDEQFVFKAPVIINILYNGFFEYPLPVESTMFFKK